MAPSRSTDDLLRPTPPEVASGLLLGAAPARSQPPAEALPPRAALEAIVAPALARPPCLVSFSGGRDSTLVLTIAAAVARREGLPPPVPITVRFADAPAAEEDWHQQALIWHLGLGDEWVRLDAAPGEFDLLGPVAARVLLRDGLLWPPNAFFHVPLFERARGGSLLTGVGGDQVLAGWNAGHAMEVLHGRARPTPRTLLSVGTAYAPRRLRAAVRRRRTDPRGWLRDTFARDLARRHAAEEADEPRRWDQRTLWAARRRAISATQWSLARLAEPSDTAVVHPLLHPTFVAALARAGGAAGLGERRSIVRALVGDLLPDVLLGRGDKALFHEVFFGGPSREFVRRWDGSGVDPALVDVDRLRAEWQREIPHAGSALLLQSAWLSGRGGGGGQAVDDVVDR